jgi:hypothetical protein
MTLEQLELLVKVTTIVGGAAAFALALVQTIKTLLEVADQVAKRRRRARRRGHPRWQRKATRPTGRGPDRRGRGPPS